MYALRVILLLIAGAVGGVAASKQGNCTKYGSVGTYNQTYHMLQSNIGTGDPTTIHCTLDKYNNYTAKQLSWMVNGSTVAAPKVFEVGDKTLVLNLAEFTTNDTGSYKCSVNGTGMCIIKVNVGHPPLRVENFSCLSHNWEYMDCNWTQPYNPIKTEYSLVFVVTGAVTTTPCNLTSRGFLQRGCNLTKTGIPLYNVYTKHFEFVMTGENILGKEKWNFTFNHLSRVKPNAPSKLVSDPILPRSARIKWEPPEGVAKYFQPHLLYKIRYRSNYDTMERTLMENRTTVKLFGLIPHARYDVSISCITVSANESDPILWSAVSTINFTTSSSVPGVPPEITNGSFHLSCVLDKCSVTVYWKAIPRYLWHGENFTYDVVVVPLDPMEDESEGATTIPLVSDVTHGSAHVNNLVASRSYRLELHSKNEKGLSAEQSELIFYAKENLLQRPATIVVTGFSQTLYEISWAPPTSNSASVTGYKVFVFSSPTPFLKSPNGAMMWESVDQDTFRKNVTVVDEGPFFSFGVVATGGNRYSDIEWNTCIVYFNGTIGKMKKVDVDTSDATSVTVKWCLDCAEKKGIITGYNIHYCLTSRENNTSCINGVKNYTVEGAQKDRFVIPNLKPNSCYQISVSAVTRAGYGEYSDPMFSWTSEAAPDRPDQVSVSHVTNSSFLVSWKSPLESNGCITKYNVRYFSGSCEEVVQVVNVSNCGASVPALYSENITFNVFPYNNYSVSVQACTLAGCSRNSESCSAFTKIGVPSQMEPPLLRTLNDTHLLVQPHMLRDVNGPSLVWDLEVVEMVRSNRTETRSRMDGIRVNMTYITIPCNVEEENRRATDGDAAANHTQVRTRAVNMLEDGSLLEGAWSEFADVHCLSADYNVFEIVGFAIAATFGMMVVGCVAVYIFKEGKAYIKKISSIKVILPQGIEADTNEKFENGMRQFDGGLRQQKKDNHYSRLDVICDSLPTDKLLNDDARFRNASGDTTRSNCSTDGLLNGRNWANDSVASGTQDSTSSRPSTATTNVSTDSSMELASSIPESPDSVFTEHPLKNAALPQANAASVGAAAAAALFNPTLGPIGETLDGGSCSDTPQHYSKFAAYYKRDREDDGQPPPQPPTSPHAAISSGYVAAPYSKFALGGSEAPWRHTVADFDNLSRHVQPPEYDNSSTSPPPVVASSYSKFGAGDSAYPRPLTFDKVDPSVHPIPATSTPTRLSPGYSVFGVTDGHEEEQGANKGYVLATALNGASLSLDDPAAKRHLTPSPTASYVFDDDDAEDLSSVAVDLSGHKRSPSNASSLTAGYCRVALSRPTSVGSDAGQFAAADLGPPPSNLPNSPAKGSDAGGGGSGLRSPSIDIPSSVYQNGFAEAADGDGGDSAGGAGLSSGYATIQQILGSDGNS